MNRQAQDLGTDLVELGLLSARDLHEVLAELGDRGPDQLWAILVARGLIQERPGEELRETSKSKSLLNIRLRKYQLL